MAFPVDEQRISVAEGELGRTLPIPLKQRLLRENGGEISIDDRDWALYPVFDPTDRRRAIRSVNHIVLETAQWRGWHGFPSGAIAIAEDGSGNALIVQQGSDEIEIWDHETGEVEAVAIDWQA